MAYLFRILILLPLIITTGCDSPEEDREGGDGTPSDTSLGRADSVAEEEAELRIPSLLTFEIADSLFADERTMIETFGRGNVDSGEIHVGEGEILPATVLFPEDPERRLKVTWHDPEERSSPERIVIEEKPSRWSVQPGFSTGTTLDSLEKLNGRPFELLGFDWDYAGTVVNWSEGRLDSLESESRWLVVRLRPTDEDRERVGEEMMARVMGDAMFGSDHRVMREVNPQVYQILMIFAGND